MSMKISKSIGLKMAVAVALMMVMLAPGCLTGPEPKQTPAFSMTVIGGTQNAMAGDNLTFIVKMKNNQPVPDAVNLTVPFMPTEWVVALSNTTFEFTSRGYRAVFVNVSVPPDAPAGERVVKLQAVSAAKGSAKGLVNIQIKVIKPGGDRVSDGNNIRVDYIGYLPDHTVFDTSVKAVGSDLSIPKSSSFKAPLDNIYQPLAFQVGKGQMIKGFDKGVLGMTEGQWRTIVVEPKDGYGQFETVKMGITEDFPMVHNITPLNFTVAYGEEPVLNKVVVEPFWNWEVHVLGITPDNITVLTLPQPNQVSMPFGWETKVIEVNGSADGGTGRITVRHYPTAGTNVTYKGLPAQIALMTSTSIELAYNLAASNPLATQTLFFSVKVVSIG